MTPKAKRELLEAIRQRYLRSNRAGKKLILDEFCAVTGYHRKYAIRVLKYRPKSRGERKSGRRKIYRRSKVVEHWYGSGKSVVGSVHADCSLSSLRSSGYWNTIRELVLPEDVKTALVTDEPGQH